MVVPLFVGREKSIKALQEVMKNDKSIVLVTQKNSEIDDPNGKELYQYGCLSKVLQLLKLHFLFEPFSPFQYFLQAFVSVFYVKQNLW